MLVNKAAHNSLLQRAERIVAPVLAQGRVERGRQRAYDVLTQNRDKLDLVVNKLIEQETLETVEFNRLFDDGDKSLPVAAATGGPDTMPPGAPAGELKREKPEMGKGPQTAPTPA